jgi:hypothetical protein
MNTNNSNNSNNNENNNSKITFCTYCKKREVNGHVIATCHALAAKIERNKMTQNDFGKTYTKSLASNPKALENIKCHWCDEFGHYKSDCKSMELFLITEERVRHELRYAKNQEYEKTVNHLIHDTVAVAITNVRPMKDAPEFAWASVVLHGIHHETK